MHRKLDGLHSIFYAQVIGPPPVLIRLIWYRDPLQKSPWIPRSPRFCTKFCLYCSPHIRHSSACADQATLDVGDTFECLQRYESRDSIMSLWTSIEFHTNRVYGPRSPNCNCSLRVCQHHNPILQSQTCNQCVVQPGTDILLSPRSVPFDYSRCKQFKAGCA